MLFVILLALGAVLLILFLGLLNMARAKDSPEGRERAQKLMRLRVLAQAGAVLLLFFAAIFAS